MSDIIDIIRKRRSVRSYKDKPVEKDKLLKVLEAARWSPSSGNVQNWRFVIVDNPTIKSQLADACYGQYWLTTTPIIIVIASDESRLRMLFGSKGESLYSIQNCSVAMANMMLEAESIGLNTCWVGAFDEEAVLRTLRIEDPDIRIRGIIALGYGKEIPPPPIRLDLDHLTFFNQWGNRMFK